MQTKIKLRIAETNRKAKRQTEIKLRIAEVNCDLNENSQYKPRFNQDVTKMKPRCYLE